MLVQELTVEDDTWSKILQGVVHDVYHLPGYTSLEAQRLQGRPVGYLVRTQNDSGNCWLFIPAIVRPIFSSGAFDLTNAYGYPGPLWSQNALQTPGFAHSAVTAWVEYLRTAGIVSVFLRFHPLWLQPEAAWRRHGVLYNQGETVSVDLTLPPAQRWQQMRKSHRYEIKQLQKRNDLVVFIDKDWSYFKAFMECYRATMEKVGASAHYYFPPEFLLAQRERLRTALHLCIVRIGDTVAGAGLFTERRGIVQYHLSGTRQEFANFPIMKLMLYYMQSWAEQRGNRMLHLGGGVGAQADSLFFFKAGFSPVRHTFSTWRALIDHDTYRALVNERRQAAGFSPSTELRLDGFFPEYRSQAI